MLSNTLRQARRIMKIKILGVAAVFALMSAAGIANAKGCVKGATVGGVAGHFAGHHGLAGAAVGCAIGHHKAKVTTRRDGGSYTAVPRYDERPGSAGREYDQRRDR